jgi:hypothetical protein
MYIDYKGRSAAVCVVADASCVDASKGGGWLAVEDPCELRADFDWASFSFF